MNYKLIKLSGILIHLCMVLSAMLAMSVRAAEESIVLGPAENVPVKITDYFIFTSDQPVVLEISVRTSATTLDGRQLAYEVCDFWGNRIDQGMARIHQAEGKTGICLKPRVPGLGWYRVGFSAEPGDSSLKIGYAANPEQILDQARFLTFAVIPRPLPPERRAPQFGLDTAVSAYERKYLELSAELASAAGVAWCRERFDWPRVNPNPDQFNWNHFDNVMDAYASRGLEVMCVFQRSPNWTRRDDLVRFPDDLLAAHRYGMEVARHYKGRVFGWELWNEQDIAHFGGGTPDHYTAMAKAIALGMKSVPNGPLVSNGPFARSPNVFNEILWENELTHYLDAYDYHAYAPFTAGKFQAQAEIHPREAFRHGFRNKEKWISEIGALWRRSAEKISFEKAHEGQTHYLVRAYAEYIVGGVDRIGWFILRPYFGQTKGSLQTGLVRADWTPYPAYVALAVMTSTLGKAEYQGDLRFGRLQGYVFGTGPGPGRREQVAMVWKEEGEPETLDIRKFEGVEAINVMGSRIDTSRGKISVGRMPVYLKSVDWSDRIEKPATVSGGVKEMNYPDDCVFDVVLFGVIDRDRIIQRLDEPLENFDFLATNWAPAAYRFTPGETVNLQMEVYNFSDRKIEGTIHFEPATGAEVIVSSPSVAIGPMGKAVVPVSIRTSLETKEFKLKARARVGDGQTTSCVSLWQPKPKAESGKHP
ncbi:hypothetical protein OH491_03790 [Termitidicoccus mucosus]